MKKEGVKSVLTKSIISLIILIIILISVSSISLSDTYVSDEPLTSNNETVVFISSEKADKVEYVVYTDYNNDGNEGDASATSNAFATSATLVKGSTKESKESVDVVDIAPIYGKAIENFNAYSNKKNIDVCNCGRFTDTLKITNTGSTTTHYIIKKGGSGAKFVSYLPTELLLNPGESQSISMVGNVPCLGAVGSYTLQTYFETLAGSSKILTQQLNIKECDSFKAYPVYPSYKNAPCTPTSYNINIQNLKDIPDTFKLSLDNSVNKASYYANKEQSINKAYYKFTEPFVLLAPKEQKTVSLIVNLPCEFSETYKFNVNVISTQTKKEQEFPLYLTIDKKGYSFGLNLGLPVKIENYTKKVPFTVKTNNLFSFCSNDIQLIPVKLTNLADFSNTYKISTIDEIDDDNDDGSDVLKTPASVTLASKQSALLNNYYYADKEELGNHTYTLQIVSEKGKLAGKLPINVEVKDCTKPNATETGTEQQKSKKYAGLILLLFAFILIIVLLLLFFIFLLKPKKTLFDELDNQLKEESLKDKADNEEDEEKINKAVENLKAGLKKETKLSEKEAAGEKEITEEIIDTFQDEEPSSWWRPLLVFLVFIVGLLILYFIWPYLIGENGINALNETSNETSTLTANETLIAPSITPPSTEKTSKITVASVTDNALKDKPSPETENLTETSETVIAELPNASWWSKFLSWFNWLTPDKLSDVTILNETVQTKDETELSSSDSLDNQSNVSQESKGSKSIQTIQPVVFDPKAFITQKEIDFTYRYWDEDTALTIDLSKYFIDVDNDKLTFTNSKAPYVDVEYNGTTAYLIPHRNWFGESSIVFTASDGKGGMASTPEIVLVVRHAPEWFKWLKHYAWYVGVGAGLIILLIIILISYGIHTKRKPKKILLRKK